MAERVDKVEQRIESICSDREKEVEQVVGHVTFGLKSEILHEVEKEIEALETRLMVKMNEASQTMATRL